MHSVFTFSSGSSSTRVHVRTRVCVCFWVCAACNDVLALECEARAERGCVRRVGGKGGGGGGGEKKSVCSWVVVQPKAMVCLGPGNAVLVCTLQCPILHTMSEYEVTQEQPRDAIFLSPQSLSTRPLHRIANCGSDLQGGPLLKKGRRKRIEHVGGRPGRGGAAIDRASRQGGEREGRRAREYEGSSSGVDPAPGGAARRMRAVLPPRTRPEGGHREGEEEPRVLGKAEPAVEGPGRRA